MSPPDPLSTTALLGESAWLHRLALRLVADPSGAEDAAQETLVKAFARPPSAGVPLRRWLAAVLRNVVRQERRSQSRREVREQARPGPANAEPADALLERLELHGKLVAAVRGLAEPYRTTVALHFLEDLKPPAVAARMGVPLKTVHTRLDRALALLRERLDREHGDRATWMRVFLPLLPHRPLPPAAQTAPLAASLFAMSTLWKWTGACAALLTLGFLGVRSFERREPRAAPTSIESAAPAPGLVLSPAPDVAAVTPAAREAVAAAPLAHERAAPRLEPTPAAPTLHGTVQDIERRPVAGLTVSYQAIGPTPMHPEPGEASGARAESDLEGRFELPLVADRLRITATGRGYATAIAPTTSGRAPIEPPVVFVARAERYSGRVVDENGGPIAGAELSISLDRSRSRELTPGTFSGLSPIAECTSDARGAFEFPEVGGVPESLLLATAEGFAPTSLRLPPGSSATLVVQLAASRESSSLSGRVVHEDGAPAAGAHVALGHRSTRTDLEGAFAFSVDPDSGARADRVRAVLPGFLPADRVLTDSEAREDVLLVLGGPPLEIRGRVVDAEGHGVPGAQVWTTGGERFGNIETKVGDMNFLLTFDVEGVIAGPDADQRDGRRTRAAEDGTFVLSGLLDHRYPVYALDPRSSAIAGPLEALAGGEVTLRVPDEPRQRVAGRVTTLSGAPIAEAYVRVQRQGSDLSGAPLTLQAEHDLGLQTDDEGRFAFETLCTTGTRLVVSSGGSPDETTFPLSEQPDLANVRLAIPAACHVRVTLSDPGMADDLTFLDEHDEELLCMFQIGGVLVGSAGVRIEGGASDLLTIDERARTLVLTRANAEVARMPLHLVPGEMNEIRP